MARYIFHIDYGEYLRDMEGTELPSAAAARAEAVQMIGFLPTTATVSGTSRTSGSP
jgi:hypothetical protein